MKLFKKSGFTLIELLVVIAVLGVLASVILIAINPTEQLARGRDAGRKNGVSQLGNAVEAFYTSRAQYPGYTSAWTTDLITSSDLKTNPPSITATGYIPCTAAGATQIVNNYCYNTGTGEAIVYARLESKSESSRCTVVATFAYWAWASAAARAGRTCQAANWQPAGNAIPFFVD